MVAGSVGLAEGHYPLVLDAADLLKSAGGGAIPRVMARCAYEVVLSMQRTVHVK